jgi:ferric-dicitrate binding protein FerR (iron transport regulator)
MSSCRQARAAILANVRQQASEAERLCLEEHLQICSTCRTEKAQWKMMECLRDDPGARLSGDARARILRNLMAVPQTLPLRPKRPVRFAHPVLALAAAGVLIAALGIWRWPSGSGTGTASGPTSVRAQAAGVLASAGAHIAYRAGSAFDVQPERRELRLMQGEVDIEVTPGGPGHFSVITPRFVVQVLGTRFVVGMERVKTLHGVVRVVDSEGRELSIVPAGQAWQLGQAPLQIQAQAPTASPAPAAPAVVAEDKPVVHLPKTRVLALRTAEPRAPAAKPTAEIPAETPSVDVLLSQARLMLATGDTNKAREGIGRALAAHPTIRQRASAELLTANSLLAERRYPEAMVAFRRTATIYANQPEGELASFALAQLLAEQGSGAESQAAYRHYLDSYPTGQFVTEVRRRLHLPKAQDQQPSP